MPVPGKLGKLPPDPTKPKLSLATLLPAPEVAPIPSVVDYISQVSEAWPMYDNDKYGICTFAAAGHVVQAETHYGQGKTFTLPLAAIDRGYHDLTGWNASDPSTDNGAVLQDVLNYWRKIGIGGNKILAFASVDLHNHIEIAAALYYFGHLIIGFEVTQSAMDQYAANQMWSVTKNPGKSLGGHAVNIGYDSAPDSIKRCITWGGVQAMTNEFLEAHSDEMWVVVTLDWVNTVSGSTPAGMNLAAFGDEYTALTGQPNPFPVINPPGPSGPSGPTGPVPDPVPGPILDPADIALAPVLHAYMNKRWCKPNLKARAVIQAWFDAKGGL